MTGPVPAAPRDELLEQHWAYMDRYAKEMIGGNRYLVLGLGMGQPADLAVPADQDEVIAYGPLLSDDGATWLGTAATVVRLPGADDRCARKGA